MPILSTVYTKMSQDHIDSKDDMDDDRWMYVSDEELYSDSAKEKERKVVNFQNSGRGRYMLA